MILINFLIKFQFRKFSQELKLRGPKFYRSYIYKKFCSGFFENCMSKDAIRLKKNGYLILPGAAKKIVDYLENNKAVFNPEEKQIDFDRSRTNVKKLDEKLFFSMCDYELSKLIKEVYQRDFWFRENPFIMRHYGHKASQHIQAKYHVDGYNQMTIQVLMNDLDNDAFCTEILPGSDKTEWEFERNVIKQKEINKYKKVKLIGKKGDLLLFNAGSTLHRSYIGSKKREALFINLSTGWYESKPFFGII